ncbi:hypothetical protein HMPREF3036_00557 [Sutterella sp. KLE1602]|nr:hypothetical protein HMPREF3036_00557 [Sutterella sp. KLE1602]
MARSSLKPGHFCTHFPRIFGPVSGPFRTIFKVFRITMPPLRGRLIETLPLAFNWNTGIYTISFTSASIIRAD